MIRIIKAAVRAVRNELANGESGWVSLTGDSGLSVGGRNSNAGQLVNPETAMQHSAVFACVQRTSQLVSTMPLDLIERGEDGSRRQLNNDLSRIIALSPNSVQTSPEFWEGQIAHQLLRGNAYAEKQFIGKNLVGIRPLQRCTPKKKGRGWTYDVYEGGKLFKLPAENILHLRGFGAGDGMGLSTVKYGANSIGAALAADQTGGSVFSNMMMASGIITSDQTLNKEQREKIQSMLAAYAGSTRAGKAMVLEAGLGWQQLQMNPEDAQLLDTRRFSVEEICRWFGIPPIVIGHSAEGQTMWGSGVEAIMLSWLTTGINPLLRRLEARLDRDLIPVEKRGKWFFRFNREAMLQMDSKAKGDFLTKMRFSGIMSGDEGRDKLGLERRGGVNDELFIQSSMELMSLIGKDRDDG